MIEGVTGVVLTGGRSRRFGSNKALAPWRGERLIEAPVRVLAGLFRETLIAAKDPGAYDFLAGDGIRVVRDDSPSSHPAVGVLAGLRAAATERIFVCACDMPLIRPALVRRLCAAARDHDAAVPVWRGQAQPLCAVYSQRCRYALEGLFSRGTPGLREIFAAVDTRFLPEHAAAVDDPRGLSFFDVDTPAALREAVHAY
ncbi:MAG: molybdenum cofactor guanylyltransferase [Elusimicrobiota bacterium]